MGNGSVHPLNLNPGSTTWRYVVRFTPRPLYPKVTRTRYLLARKLVRPQNQCLPFWRQKKLLPLPGIETETLSNPPRQLICPGYLVQNNNVKESAYTISWDECRHHQLLPGICNPNTFSLKSVYITGPWSLLTDLRCLQLRPCVASPHNWRHNVTSGANR
jgi:hypothetical protein